MHPITIVDSTDTYLLIRKPAGRASSRWSSFSLLDAITGQTDPLWIWQREIFGHDDEYGLLNRLDNETTGIITFARSLEAKAQYQRLQDEWTITKTYYATVYGQMQWEFGWITTPIYHHRDDPSRMTTDPEKGRGQAQEVITYWEKTSPSFPLPWTGYILSEREVHKDLPLSARERGWGEVLRLQITAGCRHQIRCHLASIGHPIIGDILYTGDFWKKYCKKRQISLSSRLDLVSAGIEIATDITV